MSLEHLSPLDRDNVKWVAAHRSFSEGIRTRYKAAEQGLPFQGFIQQVF
jgi:predicted DNA binding CopG/RHH family protein